MISLTPFERGLHRALVARARNSSPDDLESAIITYGSLGREVDPDGSSRYPMTRPPLRGFNEALGHVSMYEVERGRPMLSALAVNGDTRQPGDGFVKLARHLSIEVTDKASFWPEELARVVNFWSADDVVLVIDAATDRILKQLAEVKAILRRLG